MDCNIPEVHRIKYSKCQAHQESKSSKINRLSQECIPHDPHTILSRTHCLGLFSLQEPSPIQSSLVFESFRPVLLLLSPDQCCIEAEGAQKTPHNSMFAQFQLKEMPWGKQPWGLCGEPLLLSRSHVRKIWSAGAGVCQTLAVRRACDVSHFRMVTTMCTTPPSFFLLFLSCQTNA